MNKQNNLIRCRTCYGECPNLQPLDAQSSKFPTKSLNDLLLIVAKIDAKIAGHIKKLPRNLCVKCVNELENAYTFVKQAQEVNERLLSCLSKADCLTEAPIDIPLDNAGNDIRLIKVEKECEEINFEEHFDDNKAVCETNVDNFSIKQIYEEENVHNLDTEEAPIDPITVELQWHGSEENEEEEDEPEPEAEAVAEAEAEDEAEEVKKYVNIKTDKIKKRALKRSNKHTEYAKRMKPESARFECELCLKTFAWRKDLQRHALTHTATPEYECSICGRQFLRKDKLKDHMRVHDKNKIVIKRETPNAEQEFVKRLYASEPIGRIECLLCNSQFTNTDELKVHLLLHTTPNSAATFSMESELMQKLLQENNNNLEKVVSLVSAEIMSQQISRYCNITNESGYEMSLSDCEENNKSALKLVCELCHEAFGSKYALVEHVEYVHCSDTLPYKCALCQLHFVSDKLFQHHLRTQCRNKEKTHQCEECHVKFMWLDNLQKHQCQPREVILQSSLRSIECYLCNKKFKNLSSLRKHLQDHATGNIDIDLRNAKYYQTNMSAFEQQSEEYIKNYIRNELQTGVLMWRFYNATDKTGKELDLTDSETDADITTEVGSYKCALCPWRAADSRRKQLLAHQTIEHAEKLPFECQVCHLQFVANELLQQHLKRVCNKPVEQKLNCPHCSAIFIWQSNLEKHAKQCINFQSAMKNNGNSGAEPSRKLQCEHCGKEFNWAKDLTRHKRIHLPDDEKVACPICDRKFARKDNMQAHLKVHGEAALKQNLQKKCSKKTKELELKEEPDKKFECIPCGRTFMLLRDLTRHNVMHNRDAAIHDCLWCARKFFRLENLQMHIRRHDVTPKQWEAARCLVQNTVRRFGVKRMLCRLCNSTEFRTVSALRHHMQQEMLAKGINDHMQLHAHYSIVNELGYELNIDESETEDEQEYQADATRKQNYACEVCNISFQRKYQVMNHQLALHKWEKLPHKCERCVFRTVCKDILYQHMQTQCFNMQKQFGCELCHHRFMWPENLQLHKQNIHAKTDNSEQTAELDATAVKLPDEQSFECPNCGDTFNRADRLKMHVLKKHDQKKNTVKKEEKKYLCAFCGRALSSSSNLIIHMRRHTGEKPFKCEFCDKAFPRSSDMMCHRRTHTGERPHKCTVCNKAFSRSYKLQTHMRIHSGERPYKCTFCEKSFTQSNDLVLHIRRHTGERPYVCGICGERFIQSTALRNHRTMRGHFEANEPRRGNFLEKFDLV